MQLGDTLHHRLLLALLAIVALCGDGSSAQVNALPGGDVKAFVGIRASPNRPSGRPGGTFVADDLLPGESVRLNVSAGRGGDLCLTGVWATEDPRGRPPIAVLESERAALFVWRFDISLIEIATDKITLDLAWQRISRATPNDILSLRQRVTLREGDSLPVDLLHGPSGGDCASLVLEMTAGIQEDPSLQGRTIDWELWLTGSQLVAPIHRGVSTLHGDGATYTFDPVAMTTTDLNGQRDDAWVQVYGQLRGRIRADGGIDVGLGVDRLVSVGGNNPPSPVLARRLWPGGFGQKNFTVTPGEAVKILLPALGSATQRPSNSLRGNRTSGNASTEANEMALTIQARWR